MKQTKIMLLAIVAAFTSVASAQHFNIKASYGLVNSPDSYYGTGAVSLFERNKSHFRLDLNYTVYTNLNIGVYVGYSSLNSPAKRIDDSALDEIPPLDETTGNQVGSTITPYSNSDAISYGVNIEYDVLPLLTKRDDLRFQLYVIGRMGSLSESWTESKYDENEVYLGQESHAEHIFEAGAGLGAAYYFTKNVGIFGEVLGGTFYNSNFTWRAGMTFKF